MNIINHSTITKTSTVRDQVAHHPLISFVVLAYAISWISWFLMWLMNMGTVNGLSIIGGTGPALAAMIVSAILRPEPSGVPISKHWRLFGGIWVCYLAVLAFRRLWLATGLTTAEGRVATQVVYPQLWAFLLDAMAAAVVAFVLSGIHSPRQGVRELLHSLNPRNQSVRWYWFVVAVGVYPAIVALGNTISVLFELPMPAPRATGGWY